MDDATLAQGNRLMTLILQADDPKAFAQNLISNWGAVKVLGRGEVDQATFLLAIKKLANPFAEEKTDLRRFYPEDWKRTTAIEQLSILHEIYSDLNLDGSHFVEIASRIEVPRRADGLFVVPKPSSIAAKLGIESPFGEGYGQLLEASVLAHLSNQRKFRNYRVGRMAPDQMRMRQPAADVIRKLEEEQPEGDFLVFPAQTGLKWGGYSPRNALREIEYKSKGEFPLPAWCVGHILLTNPTRLDKVETLWIDCPGDEYRFEGETGFENCLCFFFDDRLSLDFRRLGGAHDHYGSASGFTE